MTSDMHPCDMINHPPHYQQHPSGHEVIEGTECLPCCLANALKYALRAPHKGRESEDWGKCLWYLERQLDWIERHPVRHFMRQTYVLLFGTGNEAVLNRMLHYETDPTTCRVIDAVGMGGWTIIKLVIGIVEDRVEELNDYPDEVMNATG